MELEADEIDPSWAVLGRGRKETETEQGLQRTSRQLLTKRKILPWEMPAGLGWKRKASDVGVQEEADPLLRFESKWINVSSVILEKALEYLRILCKDQSLISDKWILWQLLSFLLESVSLLKELLLTLEVLEGSMFPFHSSLALSPGCPAQRPCFIDASRRSGWCLIASHWHLWFCDLRGYT